MTAPVHFTYEEIPEAGGDLCQGDILEPSKAIKLLLSEVHPHFADDKYVAFLVLTQTCDLVLRGGQRCKSRYVNLAVVRPLKDVLFALLDRECEPAQVRGRQAQGVYIADSKRRAKMLLERILNQNAQAEGLFYLHNDATVGIAESSVALLQVSVAVRAYEHYQLLVASRKGRLKAEFQSKLGWLIGHLFSRVATEDMPQADRARIAEHFLEPVSDEDERCPRWVPRANIKRANQDRVDISGMSRAQVARTLAGCRSTAPKDTAISRVLVSLRDVVAHITEEQVSEIRSRLAADAVFEASCKIQP